MTVFDYAVLTIIGISVLIGLLRGAVREVLSLGGWVAAFICANQFAEPFAGLLARAITNAGARTVIAYAVLFVGTLLIVSVLKFVLHEVIVAIGLGGIDRVIGFAIGLVRGVVIVFVIVMVGGMTALPQEPFWRGAVTAKPFETMVIAAKPWLPNEFAKRINFYPPTKA